MSGHPSEPRDLIAQLPEKMRAFAKQERDLLRMTRYQDDWLHLRADELEAALASRSPSSAQPCATCDGRRWVMKSEYKDLGGGLGSGSAWNEPCPTCCPSAPGAGRPPQEKPE